MSNWRETTFGDLIASMQLGTNELGLIENSGYPLLKMGNLTIGGFNFDKLEKIKANVSDKVIAQFRLHKGDFLFNTRNTLELVGKSAVWNNQLPKATFNSSFRAILPPVLV